MKVLAALSGGVDSAVAAALAQQAGHDVVAVHMALSRNRSGSRTAARGCCTIEDATDAGRAAAVLGIPYYVWDLSERFVAEVVDDFVAEYRAGHTPNPCARCNERIKFAALLDKALALGFDAVATGHYAVLEHPGGGEPELYRAADAAKDQSYVLAVVPRDRLRHALFPLGSMPSKGAVRALATERGLPVAAKPDSHDICFIPDGDTRGWLAARVCQQPGEIRDSTGAVVGTHDGAAGYTIGQRRGLRIGRPAPDGQPRYVLDVSVTTNTVTVGSADELLTDEVAATGPVWLARIPEPGAQVSAQIRAHGKAHPAEIAVATETAVTVHLHDPIPRVAAGQTLVVYDGDRVLGSGTVTAVSAGSC
ncbi:MAG: tRNA 2-thiouridine(34) synthase MnmA [Micrococcales bacterium]|nr:MAG: tRNA 2-thiouridine(34) synthase MnmA [Micrococcales bacterium]